MWIEGLILINVIVALVWNSGFWESVDYYISKRFPLRHLPQIIFCQLCLCFWLSVIYLIVTGNFTLIGIVAALVNAHLVEITIPLLKVVKEWLLIAVEAILPRKKY